MTNRFKRNNKISVKIHAKSISDMWLFCSQKVMTNGNERFHGLYIYLKIYIDLCIDLIDMK